MLFIFKQKFTDTGQDMPEEITIQTNVISIMYRYHKRARRLLMRLDYTDSNPSIKVTVPPNCTVNDVARFLQRAQVWLEKQLQQRNTESQLRVVFQEGAITSVLGRRVCIQRSQLTTVNQIQVNKDKLIIPEQLFETHHIQAFLQEALKQYLEQKTQEYAQTLNETVSKVSVRELKSRYGGCSSSRRISFASKLVFAPLEVIEYVCVHEVAHLKEMNHSQRFWKIVETLMPNYKDQEQWLRLNGYRLNDAWKIHKA